MDPDWKLIFTGRKEVLAKVIFLHLSVILFTGGGVPPNFFWGGGSSKFSGGGFCNFSGWGVFNFRNTVNVRPVRILLEGILVTMIFEGPFTVSDIVSLWNFVYLWTRWK